MADLIQNLTQIKSQIDIYCEKYGRPADAVKLVAVGKVHAADKIATLAGNGQQDFAENYLQEALEKIKFCQEKGFSHIRWHFIGHIQSRKCGQIAEHFDWVHTVESLKVADKLNKNRTQPLNVLLQVNIDNEDTKSGVDPEQALSLAPQIAALPNLNLRGLMVIPRPETDFSLQRAAFARCRHLLESLQGQGLALDHLSMGMTNDMEAAIAEGATMVRIGTALFGPRPTKS